MATFFVAKPPRPRNYREEQSSSDVTLSWSISIINKAALKLNDIRLKLDLAKVVRLLEQMNEKRNSHFMTFCQSPNFNSEQDLNLEEAKVEQSMLNVNLSQSHLSKELSDQCVSKLVCESNFFNEESCFLPNKQNEVKQNPSVNLKWKMVVTRNVLDQLDDQNRIMEVSKDKESSKLINTSIDECAQQNRTLKKCLKEISIKLVQYFKLNKAFPIQQMKTRDLEMFCRQLCYSNLEAPETNKEEIHSNLKESQETCDLLKQDLFAKEDEVKKYEMLIYIKDEEIASLRAIQSDLENKLGSEREKGSKNPTKHFRRFFNQLEGNMSSPVN